MNYFFGSLHAVCMRLLRTALATQASSWIYKLSDIQRSGERIMLPRNLRLATCPGWETEKRDGVRPLVDVTESPHQTLPVTATLAYIFTLGSEFLLAYVFCLVSHLLSVLPPPPKQLQINMTGRKCQSYFHFCFHFAIYVFKINIYLTDSAF